MFARWFQSRHARKMAEARIAREKAQEACNLAWVRGDMRGYNAAHTALVEATHEVMRLELGA